MARPKIRKPDDVLFRGRRLSGSLIWSANFRAKWQARYDDAQHYVDEEVLRLCEPLIPFRTGMLRSSGPINTQEGEGEVIWFTPYARYQYYMPRKVGSQAGPLKGPFWFQRMNALHGQGIIQGAKDILSGRKTTRRKS